MKQDAKTFDIDSPRPVVHSVHVTVLPRKDLVELTGSSLLHTMDVEMGSINILKRS